ncbi:MAG: ferredoxin [Oscillospiraceae bacterium]
MKVEVDQELCIGCGLCPAVAPEVFEMNADGKADAKPVASGQEDSAISALEQCPVSAIFEV